MAMVLALFKTISRLRSSKQSDFYSEVRASLAGIKLIELRKVYKRGRNYIAALDGINLDIAPGEFIVVMGPSGCGKTTLLNLIGCLDLPTSGDVIIDGISVIGLPDGALSAIRREKIGMVFQFFNLLPALSALENVALPLIIAGEGARQAEVKAKGMLELVGLSPRADHRPDELSGGEMQRVAIARALVNNPSVVLADEPTGNLDSRTGSEILNLLAKLCRDFDKTLIVATHDARAARLADRVVHLRDGAIGEAQSGPDGEII